MNPRSPVSVGRTAATVATLAALASASLFLTGCTGESYASAEGKLPPYILKEGCMFTIVGENGRSGVSSPEVTGVPEESVTASTSLDEYTITISDCQLVENSHSLPVYEDD
ncbi:MAG: hypothetical protein HKO59_02665 [Phycisphaerales bacterium]|nr:hypothetical protein [Phycisphaerae bacterium]NNF43673.1 hypothetical protein [Phycisphaerales bacterium]NNM24884.1 hypothetical protein [Phycisphaerales bacterium]